MDVFVVDDDPDTRDLMIELLQGEGYSAEAVAHGADALKRLDLLDAAAVPRLMFVDLHMPIMGGRELIERMRKDARFAGIKVIVLSGNPKSDRDIVALAVELMTKPVDLDDLLERVRVSCKPK
jgi:CheY-like chemotaxis protein